MLSVANMHLYVLSVIFLKIAKMGVCSNAECCGENLI
jgi:hypothetical protein